MKNIFYFIYILVALVGSNKANAQNSSYIFYNQHRNLVNPADIQQEKKHIISGNIRNRWLTDKDAPQTQTLLTTYKLSERIGVGVSVTNQKVFIQSQVGAYADFSYRLPLTEKTNLLMGLKAGGDFFSFDASRIKTYDTEYDPYLQSVSNNFQPNIGAGLVYQHPRFFVGFSVPNLLASEKTKFQNEKITSVATLMYFFLNGGFFWEVNTDFTLKPAFQSKFSQKTNASHDFTLATAYQKTIEVGVTYSTDDAISSYFLVSIPKLCVSVGYGYERNFTSELTNHLRNSHEILLQFHW